ncbi:TPA: hypothetical protein U1V47_002064 [Streptococcus suis]|uniref:hypothetical protein n=1 Tax=Streptococcus suis TaxID=1307 RepID=UPI0014952B4E|nr:hypothetical protein [Streptococcus suis]MDW8650081.1 hypothetical protein [Streptococcus suis]HEL2442085.1 hypothetical protein [Streptococcus suis]HEM3964268.1 hypothetical protein [Streptococcus suis]HEM3972372.1 hypothetical protein [Streptococcus suis]HEM3976488.1 hypothetical protein [Streptococcus suis]
MTPDIFLSMTVADVLKLIKEDDGDFLEAKITKDDGNGILVRISYELVEVE